MFHDGGLYMKISKKILSLMLCMIMCIMTMATGSVYSFAEDGDYEKSEIEHTVEIGDNTLIYTIENGEITIVGCEGESYGVLEIPEEIDGYPVATIGEEAFAGSLNISIKVPNTVKRIKDTAFYRVLNIEYNGDARGSTWGARSINGYIEDGMVYSDNTKERLVGCSYGKTKIVIPESVIYINFGNFLYDDDYIGMNFLNKCKNLQAIEVDENNEYFTSVDGVLFDKNKELLIKYPDGKRDASYTVPDSVKAIICANNCQSLKKLILGDNIETILPGAFFNCNNLTEISFSASLKEIEGCAFYHCNSLTEISLPDSLLSLNGSAFAECKNLKNIKIGNKLEYIGQNVFGNTAFYNDKNNWTEDGFLYINKYLISSEFCTKNYVEIREGTQLIAGAAFLDNHSIVEVTIPDSIKCIGDYTFYNCTNLKNINWGRGLKNIGNGSFGECDSLTEISLPDSLITLGEFVFIDCENLKYIRIGENLESIGSGAFYDSPNIMRFDVSPSNKYFYTDTAGVLFSKYEMGISNIRLISFPSSSDITSYTVSKNVSEIDYDAFDKCSNLNQIYVEEGNPTYTSDGSAIFSAGYRLDDGLVAEGTLIHLFMKSNRYIVPKTTTIGGIKYPVADVRCPVANNTENPTILDIPKNVYYVDSSNVSPDYIFYEGTQEEWKNGPGYYYDYYNDGHTTVIYEAYGKDLDEVIKEHPEIKTEDHEITITENDSSKTGIIATTMNTTFNEPVQIAVNKAFTKAEQTQISAVVKDKDAVVYNIALVNKNGGTITNLNGGTVTLKVPETLVGDNINDLNVYHITHDGKTELFSTKNNTISIEYIDGMKYFCFDITNWSPFIFEPIEKEPSPPEKLTVDFINDSISLNYKSSTKLNVTYGPVHGDYTMKYESSNPKVASVDDNGKVTALKKGSATITCTVTDSNGNSASDTCEVKVVYTWWQWLIKIVLFGWIWY